MRNNLFHKKVNQKRFIRVLLIFLLFLCLIPNVSASWDNTSYTARMPVQINNTGCNTALEYHQVYFNVTYDVDMDDNFTDLIFYNNTDNTIIPHWNMTLVNESYLEGYFNVTYLEASSWTNDTVYLYFMNTEAESASDRDATLLAFDDYEGDLSKWTIESGTWAIENGELSGEGAGFISFSGWNTSQSDYAIRAKIKYISATSPRGDIIWRWNTYWYQLEPSADLDDVRIHDSDGWGVIAGPYTYTIDIDTQYNIECAGLGSALKGRIWGIGANIPSWQLEGTDTSYTTGKIGFKSWTTGTHVHFDDFIVRKYASPEPDVVFGEKEYYTPPLPDAIHVELIDLFHEGHDILHYRDGKLVTVYRHGDYVILQSGDVLFVKTTGLDIAKSPETSYKYVTNLYGFLFILLVIFTLLIVGVYIVKRGIK